MSLSLWPKFGSGVHPNSWLESHFVLLLLAKMIEYSVFHLSLFYRFVLVKNSGQYTKNFGCLMERSNFYDNLCFPLNSFNMIEVSVK